MACTAIGRDGVAVEALVEVTAGEAVITKRVGVLSAGAGLLLGALVANEAEDAAVVVVAEALGAGVAGCRAGLFTRRSTTATATKKRPPISDQRALTTYLWRMRKSARRRLACNARIPEK